MYVPNLDVLGMRVYGVGFFWPLTSDYFLACILADFFSQEGSLEKLKCDECLREYRFHYEHTGRYTQSPPFIIPFKYVSS